MIAFDVVNLLDLYIVCIVKEVASFLKLGQLMAIACKECMTEVELGL